MKNNTKNILSVLVLGLSLGIAGCAGDDDVTEFIDPISPADQTYNEGLANIDAGNWTEAAKKFQKVDRQHPYSDLAKQAAVMLTFVSYEQGNYLDAIENGERFVSLYPSHEEAPYALYLVGMSHFRQIVDVTRDQGSSHETVRIMNEIVTRYPESEYVEDAKRKIRVARDQLAGKEMLVGRYYQERREFIGAVSRFREVVEKYQDTRHVEEALARLTESYYALGLNSEAQTAAAVLGHNYPDSEWYQDSFTLLATGGLEPVRNRNSWISRAVSWIGVDDES